MKKVIYFVVIFCLLSKAQNTQSKQKIQIDSSEQTETEFLKTLVEISSGSNNPEGVTQVQKIFSKKLQNLGFDVELRPYPESKRGDMLFATLAGKKSEYITFVTHADTVFEKFSGFDGFKIEDDGKIARGPGVIDAKGGMVILYQGLKKFLEKSPKPKYSLRVVSSSGEEVGTPEFLDAFKNFSKDSFLILGFEPSLEDGSIINSRRGNIWYHLKVKGLEAHAGRAHKEGINACWEVSKKIDSISKLTDYKKNLTVSIGHMEGGKDKYNIVCGEASAKIDVRFSSMKDMKEVQKKIETIAKNNTIKSEQKKEAGISQLEIADQTFPFSPNLESNKYIKSILQLIKRYEGDTVDAKESGGAADSNNFSRPGIIIIDGMGARGGKIHTKEEFAELSSLKTRAQVLADFLDLVP